MKTEDLQGLQRNRDYLRNCLEQLKKAQDAVPYVQRNLEVTEWEIQALNYRPEEADEIPLPGLSAKIDRDYTYLTNHLRLIPDYDSSGLIGSTGILASGSSNVYEFVTRVGDLETPTAKAYSAKYRAAYIKLQASHDRPAEVRALLTKLGNPQTTQRFDQAFNTYMAVKGDIRLRTAAATAMRNLLDGVQGDLFDKARRWPKENMVWDEMARRLSKISADKAEQQEIINQATTRSSLIRRLSDILKDREGGSLTNIDDVWTQLLDHIFTILSLTNLA